jgi:hypothetical protein
MMDKEKKKKKINLNTVGLILLVIIGVAYFYVWQARGNAAAQVAELSDNLTAAQMQINALSVPPDDLQAQLDTVQAELAAAKTGFPNSLDRNEVLDYLLSVAADSKIVILPVASDGWKDVKIGQSYRVLNIKAAAQGSLKDVENFMTTIQSGRYPTLVITGCEITRTDIMAAGFPGDEMPVKVDMEIGVYTVAAQPGEVTPK